MDKEAEDNEEYYEEYVRLQQKAHNNSDLFCV
jgi:hypothetical protein